MSEYEQDRSTNDIAITENLTIRLENAVRALQNVSHFVPQTNKEAVLEMARNFFGTAIIGVNFQGEQDVHKLSFCHYRVRTGPGKPGKSWNFNMAFSRTGKSWKKATGPGKSWKFVTLG